jgi:transcriptional regulator with XRE-family HTH domain
MSNRFRECREKTEYTQKQVAVYLGVKPPQVSKWESGTGNPSRENCIKLAKLYGVSTDYLLGLSDEQSADNETVIHDETMQIREMLRRDPSYRLLFSAADKASPEHIRVAAAMLKALEPKEND